LTISNYVCTFNAVTVTFNPVKRLVTLRERGLDFATDAEKLFAGDAATFVDDRFDYGEVRWLTIWVDERANGRDGVNRPSPESPHHFDEVLPC
jgi:hypothetical protein